MDVASGFEQSIYDDRTTAKGESSILQVRLSRLINVSELLPGHGPRRCLDHVSG